MIFIDTSALFALLDRDDDAHRRARAFFEQGPPSLLTHNYVVAETTALVHRRLGAVLGRTLLEDLMPVIAIRWVDEEIHRAATSAFLAAVRRRTSLVDWVSFEVMRRDGIEQAFTFDRDFVSTGFEIVP